MKRTNPIFALLAVLVLGLAFAACGGDDESSSSGGGGGSSSGSEPAGNEIQTVDGAEGKTVTVGSKNFTEQFVLGEIYSQALEAAGFTVKKQLNLGSELIAYKALQAGKVDAYPEYTGTALTSFFERQDDRRAARRAEGLRGRQGGLRGEGHHRAAPDAVREHVPPRHDQGDDREARRPDEDLRPQGQGARTLSITGFPECKQRHDCLIGVEETYDLKFGKFVASEQKYQVLDSGDADVAFIFTTDGDLATGKYVIARRRQEVLPALQRHVRDPQRGRWRSIGPDGQKVIEDVQKPLTEKVMQELNARVDVDKQKPEEVAKAYLESAGFIPKS